MKSRLYISCGQQDSPPLVYRSIGEFSSNCLSNDFVASILHFACSCYCFCRLRALHVHFSVLFPTSHIRRHFHLNWFLQKLVHLFFDRVLVTSLHKSACEVHASHVLVVTMGSWVAPKDLEFLVEDVFTMASLHHTIIDYQLRNNFESLVTMEWQVFAVAVQNLSMLLDPILHCASVGALVWEQSLGTSVIHVFLCCLGELRAPSKWLTCRYLIQVINGILDSSLPLISSQVGFAVSL